MLDLGDTVTLAATCRNSAGAAANATTAAVTVTLPDGTTAPAQSPTNPPATTGAYTHPFVTTQYGLHRYRWTFTGGVPDQAHTDVFNVADSNWPAFVGLTEVKDHLNIPAATTTHDEELRGFVLSASEVVENIVGSVGRRTVVETLSSLGRTAIPLRDGPAISVTSVTENGTALTANDYHLSDGGVLYRKSGYTRRCWAHGVGNITVTYVAGRAAVPWAVLDATKELIRINWRPQAGGNYSVFSQGPGDDFGQQQGEIRLGFFVPNTVVQRLQPSALGPLVA